MTFATLHGSGDQTLRLQFSTDLLHLVQRVEAYRDYRRTIAELEKLNAAQLADLGLSRKDIRDVARRAVYGADL